MKHGNKAARKREELVQHIGQQQLRLQAEKDMGKIIATFLSPTAVKSCINLAAMTETMLGEFLTYTNEIRAMKKDVESVLLEAAEQLNAKESNKRAYYVMLQDAYNKRIREIKSMEKILRDQLTLVKALSPSKQETLDKVDEMLYEKIEQKVKQNN